MPARHSSVLAEAPLRIPVCILSVRWLVEENHVKHI